MKKIRLFILTMIFTLSFVCSAFADDRKLIYSIVHADGNNKYEFYCPYPKAVSTGWHASPNAENHKGGSISAFWVIPKKFASSGKSLNLSSFKDSLLNRYGWSQDEIDFASSNFYFDYQGVGISYDAVNYNYTLSVDYPFMPTQDEFDSKNGYNLVCACLDKLKPYLTSLEYWDENGFLPLPAPQEPEEKLPNFTYKVSKKWHPHWTTNILQYNFYANWDSTEHEIYKSAPNNYYVECKAKLYMSGLSSSNSILIDKQPIVKNEISFSIDETMDKLLDSPLPDASGQPDVYYPYYVMFRVISSDGSKCSDWHFYLIEPQSGNKITDSGSFSENDSGDYELTDGPTDGDSEKIDNSNFTKDPNGGNTSASQNPDSAIYNDSSASVNASSLVTNLKSSVESIKDIAGMISVCYQWLPSWLLSLIACSIGIIVVVGLFNIIRG